MSVFHKFTLRTVRVMFVDNVLERGQRKGNHLGKSLPPAGIPIQAKPN